MYLFLCIIYSMHLPCLLFWKLHNVSIVVQLVVVLRLDALQPTSFEIVGCFKILFIIEMEWKNYISVSTFFLCAVACFLLIAFLAVSVHRFDSQKMHLLIKMFFNGSICQMRKCVCNQKVYNFALRMDVISIYLFEMFLCF